MITVEMTVNELAEEVPMDVEPVKKNIGNPIIKLTIVNNYTGFNVQSINVIAVIDGVLTYKLLVAPSGRRASCNVMAISSGVEYVFDPKFENMNNKRFANLVNLEVAYETMVRVIDPTKSASMEIVYYPDSPLPPM